MRTRIYCLYNLQNFLINVFFFYQFKCNYHADYIGKTLQFGRVCVERISHHLRVCFQKDQLQNLHKCTITSVSATSEYHIKSAILFRLS